MRSTSPLFNGSFLAAWLAVLVVGFGSSGCAGLMKELGAGKKRDGGGEVRAAVRAHDEPALEALCADEGLGPAGDSRYPRYEACRELEALRRDKDDGDCTTVVARFKNAERLDGEDAFDSAAKWARRVATCRNYKALFEEFAHLGEDAEKSTGIRVLQLLEKEGVPVFAAFGTYANEHGGAAFLNVKPASFAANHVAHWLIQGGHLDQCPVLDKALTGSSETTRAAMLFYFVEARCPVQGTALAAGLLAAESGAHRTWACTTLGKLGGPAVLKKLRIVADSDTYFIVQETRGNDGRIYASKVFPVRDACRDAAAKLQLR